ncbi:hypothetical protein CRM22_007965, partial [Opisthorchis felineus]
MQLPLAGFEAGKNASSISACRIQWHQVSVGLIRLIGEASALMDFSGNAPYMDSWAPLVGRIVAGVEAGPGRAGEPAIDNAVSFLNQASVGSIGPAAEERFIELEADVSTNQAAFGHLTFAVQRIPELCSSIADPRIYLANTLRQLSTSSPGKV